MQCSRKLKVTDLNPHLICVLCGGYYVDATTIIECLHSFCRSCIVRYLETNKYCPICDVQVHKTRPLQNIRPDDTLQTIVYKLVPGLYQNEMRCRREFYAKHPEAKVQALPPEATGELTDHSRIFLPDEPISLCLEYVGATNSQTDQQGPWGRRYLRCPAAVSVSHLHKLIRAKFGLAMGHRVDVFYKEDILHNNWTLMDIAYIYQWKRKSPMHLSYQILESHRKRIKLSHDSVSTIESSEMETSSITGESNLDKPSDSSKQSTTTTSVVNVIPADISSPTNEILSVSATTSTTSVTDSSNKTNVEWKEVQLQISENGIMSVAGVENDRLLTPLQPISVSSQSDNTENIVRNISVNKSDSSDEKSSENKVPPIDSDPNSSALHDKVNVKCDSRTKPVETSSVSLQDSSKNENVQKNTDVKPVTKDTNHVDSLKRSSKSAIGYKLASNSDKNNAIFKSKTDKLEDAVRNIASRTEPTVKSDTTSKVAPHVLNTQTAKEAVRPKILNSESADSSSGNVNRALTPIPKVYPGIKPPIYNSLPKEESMKINNKLDPLVASGVKQTPMEILNTQNKLQNHMVKYKSHKASIKPWNPTISRAAVLAMKHAPTQSTSATANKDSNSTSSADNQQSNPPPVKPPRFFKIRNMPRFLGNPASGVKPMYQVAPGSEIITGNAAVPPATAVSTVASSSVSTSATNSTTATGSLNAQIVTSTVSTAVLTNSDTSSPSGSCSAVVSTSSPVTNTTTGVTYTSQKVAKQNINPSVTLMKIDPKTLSPITVNSAAVSHVLNNPPRATSSQPKKLPPPFTPGSPKHSNHYTNCRTAHTNGSKTTLPRTPSPAHTGGLIPTHPFIPVSHANPHLLYGAFPNPFSPTDPTSNRLLPGPTNSELIRAMSALCSSGSAFHPSLPPSISMLFNPHHAHHRPLQSERNNFKCNSNDKKATPSPPPTVQRVPPSNPTSKGYGETDMQHVNLNISNCHSEQSSNPSRLKKTKTEHPSLSTKNPAVPPAAMPVTFSSSAKISLNDNSNRQVTQHQTDVVASSQSNLSSSLPNCTIFENKKSISSSIPKLPGEKIEEITSELSVQNQKFENKSNGTGVPPSVNENSCNNDKLKAVSDKGSEVKTVNNNNEIKTVNETKPKDKQFNSINNNNNINKINKTSCVSADNKSDVDGSTLVNNNNT